MSEHVEGLNRNQTALFPNTLEEYVDKENPVRFIDAFVDSLNLEKLGFKHALPTELGRPSYDPSDLLKLYLYVAVAFSLALSARPDLLLVARAVELPKV